MSEEQYRGREVFREEAYELLAELENALLELELAPDNKEMIERAFRAMHTIKGSGLMFGFDAIADLTHEAETVYDMVRKGKLSVTRELIDLTFQVIDKIMVMIGKNEQNELLERSDDVISSFRSLLSEAGTDISHPSSLKSEKQKRKDDTGSSPMPENIPGKETEGVKVTYRIYFQPHKNIFQKGLNPIILLNELSLLGRCTVITHTDNIPCLEDFNPEECFTYWDIILSTAAGINAIRDIFIFVEDDCDINIDIIDKSDRFDNEEAHRQLGHIILEKGNLKEEDIAALTAAEDHYRNTLRHDVSNVWKKQLEVSSIRVAASKLDKLVNLVGELVTVQARLSQAAIPRGDPEMLLISEEIERLTEELRESTMNIRLIPIGTLFNRFRRLVRDLSNELGKEIEFTNEGGETELDKNVIEKLHDPLVHIIRNSIDHGIEPPTARETGGKPRTGRVHISAEYSGNKVLIKIEDDGSGIDLEEIRSEAISKGLIKDDVRLTDNDIFSVIFLPGFSTSEKVTKVSGRGVGLDVAKKSMDSLGGAINIKSVKGRGTTITLGIPLTLAIIEGLLLKVGNHQYIVPLSSVEECIELTRQDIVNAHGRHMINVREKIVPYIRLRDLFKTEGDPPDIEQIVITEVNGRKIGLTVDHVIGEHQTVVKSLGRIYRDVDIVSGASILGDGMVAIILNIPKIIEYTESDESMLCRSI